MGMSVSLLVAIPFVLLAIVLLLCFVGCDALFGLDELPDPTPFHQYTPTILTEVTLVGYWPLGESLGQTTAVDLKGGHNGTYLSQVFPDDPPVSSAAAPGTLALGQPGIVAGDTVPPHDESSARTTCIEVNGGYVSVPFDPALNPTKAEGFTIEAWVRPEWSASDTAAQRVIMASIDAAGGVNKGYALLSSAANIWQGIVLTGGGATFTNGPEVILDATSHLVLTYDGNLLRLFVNGSQSTAVATDYQPSTQSRLFIGVGGPQLPEPRGPWVGRLQCVAVYKGALEPKQVAKHTANGNGVDVS
jgi:Concanavalin A-like lectin/glucanases superfamily